MRIGLHSLTVFGPWALGRPQSFASLVPGPWSFPRDCARTMRQGPRTTRAKDDQTPRTTKGQRRPRANYDQGPRTTKDQGRTKDEGLRTKVDGKQHHTEPLSTIHAR